MASMVDSPERELAAAAAGAARREIYSLAGRDFDAVMAQKVAGVNAAFLLPHLRPGMRLLDCGAGPGSVTLGLAEAVAPGEVVGFDLRADQVEAARCLAAERGVDNVEFRVADVYELPFAEASFDVVFASQLLFHLSDPLRALKEMRRVLRPQGIVGVRDPDWGTHLRTPSNPLLDEALAVEIRAFAHVHASPTYARHQRSLLLQSGFRRAEAGGEAVCRASPEAARHAAAVAAARFASIGTIAVAEGWTTAEMAKDITAALLAWGERPDAFTCVTMCTAVGWVS